MSEVEEKKSSLWGSLKGSVKGMLVEEVPDKKGSAPPVAASIPAPAATLPIPAAMPGAVTPLYSPGFIHSSSPPPPRPQVDPEFQARLEAAIAKAAPAGYNDLLSNLATLADAIPDEASRFRAAIKLAAKHGLTVEGILNDVDKCIGLLNDSGREFEDELKRQTERKVGSRHQAVATIDSQIKAKQEQMAQLQADISALSEQRGNEAAAITVEEGKIRAIQANFRVTFDAVAQQYNEIRNKISSYGRS